MFRPMALLVITLLSVLSLPVVAAARERSQHVDTVHKAITARLNALQNLLVTYDRIDRHTPDPDLVKRFNGKRLGEGQNAPVIKIQVGTEKHHGKFRFLSGLARYDSDLSEETLALPDPPDYHHEVLSFRTDRLEHLFYNSDDRVNGIIKSYPTSVTNRLIDIGLGLRFFGERDWITPQLIKSFDIEFKDERQVVARTGRRKGIPSTEIVHEWVFDPRLRYALTAYRRIGRGNVAEDFILSEFDFTDGILLPKKLHYRRHAKSRIIQETQFQVTNYTLNDGENTPESYAIKWPKETQLLDSRKKQDRAWIGVRLMPRDVRCRVAAVVPDSPAERGEIQRGDIIVKCDDQAVEDSTNFLNLISTKKAGEKITLHILREQKTIRLDIVLDEVP